MAKSSHIFYLSFRDVLHEWRMSLCVMFAVAAISTPLLLFFGLKSGVMNTLINRMLGNPATMELMSVNEKKLDAAWFDSHRNDEKVSFVIPRTRRLSASAEFRTAGGSKAVLDLIPTGEGDPLITHYKVNVPRYEECVLSAEAAKRLSAAVGTELDLLVSRDRAKVKASRKIKVSGILPDSAGNIPVAYITLNALEQIENFKDGIAVPELGWSGIDSKVYPVTPKALIVTPLELDPVREAMLTQNSGFSSSKLYDKEYQSKHPEYLKKINLLLEPGLNVYELSTVRTPAQQGDLKTLRDRVRGMKNTVVIPYNPNLTLYIGDLSFDIRPMSAFGAPLPLNPQLAAGRTAPQPETAPAESQEIKTEQKENLTSDGDGSLSDNGETSQKKEAASADNIEKLQSGTAPESTGEAAAENGDSAAAVEKVEQKGAAEDPAVNGATVEDEGTVNDETASSGRSWAETFASTNSDGNAAPFGFGRHTGGEVLVLQADLSVTGNPNMNGRSGNGLISGAESFSSAAADEEEKQHYSNLLRDFKIDGTYDGTDSTVTATVPDPDHAVSWDNGSSAVKNPTDWNASASVQQTVHSLRTEHDRLTGYIERLRNLSTSAMKETLDTIAEKSRELEERLLVLEQSDEQELLELAGNFRDSLTSLSNTQNRIRSSVDSLAATADRLGNSSAAGADTLARIESEISSSGTGGRNAAERLKEMVNDYSAQIRNIGASAAGAGQTVAEIRREADSMLRDAESLKNYAERIYERYESVAAVVDRISDGSSELLSAVKRLAGLDDSFATGLDYVSSGLGSISTGSEHLLAELQHTASGTFIINDRGLRTAGRALLNISVLQQTGTAAAAGEPESESLKQLLAVDRGEFSDRSSHRVFYVDPEIYRRIGKDHQKVTVVYSGTRDDQTVERSVEFEAEIRALPVSADGTAFTTVALIGQLGLLQERDISDGVASDGKNAFMMKKRGYTGFRMYASSLDNVVKLQDQLTAEGIKTVSRSDRISEILSLDHYLSLLFLLIAAASLTGAVCCLVANVYAGVERKRRELAILRLLGVHGSQLCIFPIFSSLLLTLGGVLVSLVIFYILAYVVNACFVYQLSGGEKFCELQIEHVINVVIISLSIASFAGLVASRRVMRIDPSDSLRDE